MAEGVSASMPMVLKMVGDAIGLDSQNRKKEAYCQYLSCCIYISQILKDDAWDKDLKTVYNKDAAKLFKLIQQCQERALNIISSESAHLIDSPPGSPILHRTPPSQTLSPQPGNLRKYSDPLPPRPGLGHIQSPSDSLPPGSQSFSPHYRGQPLKLPSPPSSPSVKHSNKSAGQDTNNSYKPQTDRRMTGLNMRVSRPYATDKNLSSMRKMSENLLIAKAREEAIKKKVWERQQRLQIEANRRFASAVVVSKEEQEQRLLYTKILEYEQDMVWPQQLREQLKRSPEDTALINNIINRIFSSKDHPLRQFLLQYQYHVYKKLLPLLKDVKFPNEKQPEGSNDEDVLKIVSKPNIGQVEDNSHEEYARKVLEDENVEKDEMDAKNVGECDYLESRESSNIKCLDFEGEEKEIENGDDVIDSEVDTTINNVKENNSNNGDDDKEITENGCEDLSSSDDNINDNKNLDSSDTERQGKSIDNENDFGKNNDEENEESCNESRTINNDKDALLESENITLVVSEILENILAQIVGDEPNEALDNLSVMKNDLKDSGSSWGQLKLKTNADLAIDVIDEHSNVNSNRTCANKKANLAKIESFDLELEFCSLEDDMFDSESSEDEAEHDKEGSDNDLNRDTPSTLSIEPNSSMEIPSNTLEDTESSVKPEENKNQQCYGKSDEEQGDDASMGADLYTNPAESIRRNGEGESLNSEDSDDKKDSIGPEVSPVVDIEVARKQLNEIFVDMRFFLEKLKGFIILAYEELATPIGHDQCYAAVEHPFFQPLWPLLLGVLRRVNFDKEICLGSVMTKRIHETPADMGVVDRLCLSDKEPLEATGNAYPYQLAVQQLHNVATCYCPLEKLECVVRASRGICQCVEDYWECKGKPRHCSETSIGCDDLLPILCFVIVKSGMAQLISESSVMEEFIPEGYLMGEEGYCLTTLQTALAYLVTLDCA